jgi:hypothetical protein
VYRLGEEPPDDYTSLTPTQRLDMVEILSARMRELAGSERSNDDWPELLHQLLEPRLVFSSLALTRSRFTESPGRRRTWTSGSTGVRRTYRR